MRAAENAGHECYAGKSSLRTLHRHRSSRFRGTARHKCFGEDSRELATGRHTRRNTFGGWSPAVGRGRETGTAQLGLQVI
jgi:hypothetical protein